MPFEMDSTISIHAPREGGDAAHGQSCAYLFNFNPRPPRGGRHLVGLVGKASSIFQSTPPARGATMRVSIFLTPSRFQSTPPARGATFSRYKFPHLLMISIHAPREGGDTNSISIEMCCSDFNPRPPRGGRPPLLRHSGGDTYFNPRPPRGGRLRIVGVPCVRFGISIHAPREGGDRIKKLLLFGNVISIHAPREGGDTITSGSWIARWIFQSTPPARGATTARRSSAPT